ncbi:hypothetical protein H6F88_32230 [Oculatella sp. FACHB-28]|uniref:hypothetical protein n=1 Tax=Oculatella sp. FACHB-28 TaxID=2692845 RepID=UPI001689216E|nr:hypothetical protein [Oculatella sp. FACHB-28]MBD2060612.1 hypothetical protein [Oculatella sp. FACHB-28]
MNNQRPTDSHNWFQVLQSRLSTLSEEVNYDDDTVAPISREEDPDIEVKLDQIFGIDSRPD